MASEDAINHHSNMAMSIKHLHKVHSEIEQSGLDGSLANLIMLRVSQMNGCAFCVEMHAQDARNSGEQSKRLDHVVIFDHVDDFTAAEKAALSWAEALTNLEKYNDYQAMRDELRRYYSEQTISAITLVVGMINLWNRIGVSNH